MTHYVKELETALEAVKLASEICRRIQNQIDIETQTKEDRSPVTVADYCSQAVILKAIHETFPDDPIIAEEGSDGLREENGQALTKKILEEINRIYPNTGTETVYNWIDYGSSESYSQRFWTLDPIDGTKGFLRKDQYAISLALIKNGEIVLGILSCPNLTKHDPTLDSNGLLYYAGKGTGAFMAPLDGSLDNPRKISVNTTKPLHECAFCESWESGHSNHSTSSEIAQRLGISRPSVRIDSQAKYAIVAMGKADIYLRLPTKKGYREKIWDHAAGVLLVEEAGGIVTDIHGHKLDFTHGKRLTENRGVIVSNSEEIHGKLIATISEVLS